MSPSSWLDRTVPNGKGEEGASDDALLAAGGSLLNLPFQAATFLGCAN